MSLIMTGLFKMIQAVMSGQIRDIRFTPDMSLYGAERVIGVLNDPIGRVLYSEAKTTSEELHRQSNQFQATSVSRVDLALHEAMRTRYQVLKDQEELLFGLFGEALLASFPGAIRGIRSEWRVISFGLDDGVAKEAALGVKNPSLSFYSDLVWAMSADEKTVIDDVPFTPVDSVTEEYILGRITTPSLKALCVLTVGLKRAMTSTLDDLRTVSARSEQIQLKEVAGALARLKRLGEQLNLIDRLFWLGAEMDVPEVSKKDGTLALREGWTIVRIPQEVGSLEDYVSKVRLGIGLCLRQEDGG